MDDINPCISTVKVDDTKRLVLPTQNKICIQYVHVPIIDGNKSYQYDHTKAVLETPKNIK